MLEFLKLCESRAEVFGQYQKYLAYSKRTNTRVSAGFLAKLNELALRVKQIDQQIIIKKYTI